jgi:maltokinase
MSELMYPIAEEELISQVEQWLAGRRWFPSRGATVHIDRVVELEPLAQDGEDELVLLLLEAYGSVWQLPLSLQPADDEPAAADEDLVASLDAVPGSTRAIVATDATGDPRWERWIVERTVDRLGLEGTFDGGGASVRRLSGEQSNTSLVLAERVIVKLYRRLQEGTNREVEMVLGLDEAGFNHMPAPLGVWRERDRELALGQEFIPDGVDGFQLALTSLRDLCDRPGDPGQAGGDFAFEAARLGLTIGRLHLALARAFGREPAAVESVRSGIERRVEELVRLGEDVPRPEGILRRLAEVADCGQSVRIHGDLHLGQMMRAETGWMVLDFEGEPADPDGGMMRHSPLRDVAGMLRSFDYAAAMLPADQPGAWSIAWRDHNATAFLRAYLSVAGISDLLPPPGDRAVLLDALTLEKALYELAYELQYRPSWADIPRRAIEGLLR